MRFPRFALLAVFALVPFAVAQQTATTSTQATAILQSSLSALSGGQTLTDVTLSGTARRIAGSDDETGTAALKAISSGASRVDLSLPSGQRNELLNTSVSPSAGTWSGPDGISHAVAYHNLLTGPAWFFPLFPIAEGLTGSGYVATYVGHETHNGQAVEHVSVSQTSSSRSPSGALLLQHLSQVDFFLDSTTLLPAAMTFNVHPDSNALLDIPVDVRFSDYRTVSGAKVPFHVQKYLNNGLVLDFQAQSVTLNSGLAASSFSL